MIASLLFVLTAAQEHVWVDADPCRFCDDNIAVVMMARSPKKVTIDGISAVSGNTWSREGVDYMNATLKMLHLSLRTELGAQKPLVHTQEMSKHEGPLEFAGSFATPHPPMEPLSAETAVSSIEKAIEHANGQLTIVAIGPLTNLAQLLRQRPELAKRIKQIVIMGGNVHVPGNSNKTAEFNFWYDPEAAQVVLASAIPKKILFGLDICNQAVFTKAVFDRIVAAHTPVTEFYKENLGNDYPGFLKNPNVKSYLWDELTAAYMIDPGFVTKSETKYLEVGTQFGPKYGSVVVLDHPKRPGATPVEVMLDLDLNRVLGLYERLLKM